MIADPGLQAIQNNLQMLGIPSTPVQQQLGAVLSTPTPVLSAYSHPGLTVPTTSPLMGPAVPLPKPKSVWDKLFIRKPVVVKPAACHCHY